MLTIIVMMNLKKSKYGRAIMAIRDNRIAAESTGINVTYFKLAVSFIIAAFFAGAAGVRLRAQLRQPVKAASFDYNMSIEILVIVVLGRHGLSPRLDHRGHRPAGAAGARCATSARLPDAAVFHRADRHDADERLAASFAEYQEHACP